MIVWENGGTNGTGTGNTAQFLQNLARTMPPMMQVLKDIGGVELPDFIAHLKPESQDRRNGAAPAAAKDGTPPGKGEESDR